MRILTKVCKDFRDLAPDWKVFVMDNLFKKLVNQISLANYGKFSTPFTDAPTLQRTLRTRGLNPEIYSEPQPLTNNAEKAEIIVRSSHANNLKADLAFQRQPNQTFALLVSKWDSFSFNEDWLTSLAQSYQICQTATYSMNSILKTQIANHYYGLRLPRDASLEEFLEALIYQNPPVSPWGLIGIAAYAEQSFLRQRAGLCLEKFLRVNVQLPTAIGQNWLATRSDVLEELIIRQQLKITYPTRIKVYLALKLGVLKNLRPVASAEIKNLVEALNDKDSTIARNAAQALREFVDNSYAEDIVKLWAATRQPVLLQLLEAFHYTPPKSFTEARTLAALKLGRGYQTLENISRPKQLEFLVQASADKDPLIADRAKQVLRQLKRKAAKEELIRLVIEQDLPLALDAAISLDYLPEDSTRKALFYFVSEQWAKYEALDFDHRLLRAYYEAASLQTKRRLTAKVRAAGKADYLTILTGGETRSRAEKLNFEESELLVQVLTANQQWARLWELVFDLPLKWSVEALRILAQTGWQPERPAEREIFSELYSLAAQPVALNETDLNYALPPALRRAEVRVPGRVNAVAFAHEKPLLAIGTGTGRVVLWNAHTARQEQILRDFEHSIGKMAFTPSGVLLCAERTNAVDITCNIYACEEQAVKKVGQHLGSITALEALNDTLYLSAGRDGQVVVRDIAGGAIRYQYSDYESNWVRAVCLSPDRTKVALLHNSIAVVKLPELYLVNQSANKLTHKIEHATFTPDGSRIVAGQNNGSLSLCLNSRLSAARRIVDTPQPLKKFGRPSSSIEGLALLPALNILVSASADGNIDFIDWTAQETIGRVCAPGNRLISLKTSPDGYFMAVGSDDSAFSLWDLRLLYLRRLLSQPLAMGKPLHMAAIVTLNESSAEISQAVRNTIKYIETILRYRYRFDVEIADYSSIQAGDFDIEIEVTTPV